MITSSVHVAGVLLVFAFLIVPAVVSSMLFRSVGGRLFFGWGFGFALSVVGMGLSFLGDLPAGAALVMIFTLCPLLLVLMLAIWPRGRAKLASGVTSRAQDVPGK